MGVRVCVGVCGCGCVCVCVFVCVCGIDVPSHPHSIAVLFVSSDGRGQEAEEAVVPAHVVREEGVLQELLQGGLVAASACEHRHTTNPWWD